MANAKQFGENLLRRIEYLQKEAVESISGDIEKDAQINFKRAMREVPADDPHVEVKRVKNNENSYTIQCTGNQVLFIEFGAGTSHYYESSYTSLESGETAPRPIGIYPIGHYRVFNEAQRPNWEKAKVARNSRGQDDVWFYKSTTGRESKHAHLAKYNRKGNPIMITSGIRPIRALWRARASALKKYSQKISKWKGL